MRALNKFLGDQTLSNIVVVVVTWREHVMFLVLGDQIKQFHTKLHARNASKRAEEKSERKRGREGEMRFVKLFSFFFLKWCCLCFSFLPLCNVFFNLTFCIFGILRSRSEMFNKFKKTGTDFAQFKSCFLCLPTTTALKYTLLLRKEKE